MGIVNARNLRKAKQLLEQNRDKVGGIVEKAGGQLDKVSKGKTSTVTSKAADAARKYSEGAVTHHGVDQPSSAPPQSTAQTPDSTGVDPSWAAPAPKAGQPTAAQTTSAEATAAGAVTGVASALTNLLNKTAESVEKRNERASAAATTPEAASPDEERSPSN